MYKIRNGQKMDGGREIIKKAGNEGGIEGGNWQSEMEVSER